MTLGTLLQSYCQCVALFSFSSRVILYHFHVSRMAVARGTGVFCLLNLQYENEKKKKLHDVK